MATWAITYRGSRDGVDFEETVTVEYDTEPDALDELMLVARYHDAEGMRVPVFSVLRVTEVAS
jgi:hypothetical protein